MKNIHNYVFLGGSGTGKSELSINLALKLSKNNQNINFFDMDQTKPLFRSRDVKNEISNNNVKFANVNQYLDTPITPDGVTTALLSENDINIFDVGGNIAGAIMIGQYSEFFGSENSEIYYVINPFRPFCDNCDDLNKTLYGIKKATRLLDKELKFIVNPCIGQATSLEDVIMGIESALDLLGNMNKVINYICVEKKYTENISKKFDISIISINLHMNIQY